MNFINKVIHGDSLYLMDLMPNEIIDLTVTSPPYYNAREYSQYSSYQQYLDFLKDIFEKVYKITKEGRFLVVNTSPVLTPRSSRNKQSKRHGIPFDLHGILVKMGWDFIDDIIWEKPEGAVPNRNGNFYQNRKPLAYKPNIVTEYIMVYRKFSENTIGWNIQQYDKQTIQNSLVNDKYERSNVWRINTESSKTHSAIFPYQLPYNLIKYYSYKGDLIFDPFGGSGTVLRCARDLDRKFLLCEKNGVYFDQIKNENENIALFDTPVSEYVAINKFKNE